MFFFCTGLHGKLPNIVLPPEFANLCVAAFVVAIAWETSMTEALEDDKEWQ